MATLKKIWHDPVWSKVIAAAVIAMLTWIANLFFHWWSWAGLLRNAARLLKTAWEFVFSTSPVPHWLIGLGVLLIILAAAILIVASTAAHQAKSTQFAQISLPPWHSYTTDMFYEVRWRWRYDIAGQVTDLNCFCPRCDCQLFIQEPSPILFHGIPNREPTLFCCPRCGSIVRQIHERADQIELAVTAFIGRNVRNNLWGSENEEKRAAEG